MVSCELLVAYGEAQNTAERVKKSFIMVPSMNAYRITQWGAHKSKESLLVLNKLSLPPEGRTADSATKI